MKKYVAPILLMLLLVLVACTTAGEPTAVAVAQIEPTGTTAPEPTTAPTDPPPTETPTDTPTEVVEAVATEPLATEEPQPADTPTSAPTEPPAPDPIKTVGRTADGAFFIGSESAELEIIDYSDFL